MRRTKLNNLERKAVKLLSDNFKKSEIKNILDKADHYEIFYEAWKKKEALKWKIGQKA